MRSLRSVIAAMIPALYMIAVVDVIKADVWRRGYLKGGRYNGETFERPKSVSKMPSQQ